MWHFQELDCIHMYWSMWKHSGKHLVLDFRTIHYCNLIVNDWARWGVARGRWHLREIIPHRFRRGHVMLPKRPLVSWYYLRCLLRHLKTFPILPGINCISDIADWLDHHGDPFPPGWRWGLTEPKEEPYVSFLIPTNTLNSLRPSDAYMRQ